MTQRIAAIFTNSGAPATGLSPTINIYDLTGGTTVISGAAMTEFAGGVYYYDFTSYDIESDYVFRAYGGASLPTTEQYVWAGNESYVDDIWDAGVTDHQVVGSLAAEVRAGIGSVITSNGERRNITKKEAEDIAKYVWEHILIKGSTAGEVLLSRSDFNAVKDKVLLKTPVADNVKELHNIDKKLEAVGKDLSRLATKKVEVKVSPTPVTVNIPDSLLGGIASIKENIARLQAVEPKIVEIDRIIEKEKLVEIDLTEIKELIFGIKSSTNETVEKAVSGLTEQQKIELNRILRVILLQLTRSKFELFNK